MGRLFWKFFLAFLLAQCLAGVALMLTILLATDFELGPGQRPPPPLPDYFELVPEDALMHWDPGPRPDERQPPPPPPPPYLPLIAILVGCFVASALLAWYFAKPIRSLRWALGAVASGRLDTRLHSGASGWRDEIGDLGLEFDRMAQELQSLVESQRQLLHDVSHELRSPLARLQAAIGLARQDPARIERAFDRIERESERVATLVGELLTLARLDSNRDQAANAPIDLVELLSDSVEDARFEARSNGRDLDFSSSGEYLVSGRAEQLHRAFENVLRNAVRYTEPNSCIQVSVTRVSQGEVLIQVCDRGPGVAECELESIFQAFHRGRREEPGEGFGLGLAIARRAIQAHGGSIRARPHEGGGLCVEIRLPLD